MTTPYFGFKELGPGEFFADDDYKFGRADRRYMDLLFHVLMTHDHSGEVTSIAEPEDSPVVELSDEPGIGLLPAGQRVFYKYTYVDADGFESAVSPEVFIDTRSPLPTPDRATLSRGSVGGSMAPGAYFYVLSAWDGATTLESKAGPSVTTTLPAGFPCPQVRGMPPSTPSSM